MVGHIHNLHGWRYVPAVPVEVLQRFENLGGGLYWKVSVAGAVYHVARERGKAVRIPFKPRGQNRGYWWYGVVRDEKGRELYKARVFKSTGYLGILHDAGFIRWMFEQEGQA